MKRLSTILLAFSLLAIACGSEAITESGQDPADPTPVPTAPTTDEGPLGAGPYPVGTVYFFVSNSQTGEETANYTVTCLGDTATLSGDWSPADEGGLGSADDRMCRLLGEAAVQSRLVNGVPADQMCTEIYGSADFAEVSGVLDDKQIDTAFDRANGCGIDDWDNLMAGLLPLPTDS